jgi:CelD/BcsL family acetyltransferase involved in cellulose biosynthesis
MPYWAEDDAAAAEAALRDAGLRDVQRPDGAHACTLRVPLAGRSDAELFAGGAREQLRKRIRQAERVGATARRGADGDWEALPPLYRAMMGAQGRRDRPAAWWSALRRHVADETRGGLFVCEAGGRTVAAAVVLRHGAQATFGWGASVTEDLPFSKSVPALVVAIRWARDAGCERFDLGGVPLEGDDDPKRNAIARFKHVFDPHRVRLVREHAGWC